MEQSPSALPELGFDFHMSDEATAAYINLNTSVAGLVPLSIAVINCDPNPDTIAEFSVAQNKYEIALRDTTNLYVTAYRERGASDQAIRAKLMPRFLDMYQRYAQAEQKATPYVDLSSIHLSDITQLTAQIAETSDLTLKEAVDNAISKIGSLIAARTINQL